MITRKSKIIFSAIALLVLAGAIGVGAYHVFAVATNQAGVGYGAIGMDSSFNVSVGSSSPAGIARFVVNASSGASTYTLKALSSTGASLFSVDNSGNVVTAGSLTAGSFVGNLSGTVTAGNISSGAFGANTGGGIYSFPSNIGISGDTTPAQTGLLSLGYSVTNGYAWIQSFNSKPLTLNPVGNNVGIGTTNPTTALAVVGNVSSTGLCLSGVCNTTWPTSGVSSIFGRTGAVTAASGDYTVAQVTGAAPLASPTFTGSVTIVNGSLGVGMSSVPNGQMSIAGSNTTGVGPALWLYNTTGASNVGAAAEIAFSTDGSTDNTPNASIMVVQNGISGGSADTVFDNWNGGTNVETMRIRSNGNVGIGTTAPAQKLSVAGTIQSTSGGIMFPDGTTQTTAASGSTVVTAGNVSAGTFGSNTGGGNYAFSGNVGIGATTASVKLVVSGAANASSPTLGSAAVGESALLSNNGLYGLYSGVSNDGDVWMQAQRNDAGTSVYNILLNPNGGNVGIGTTGPSGKLDVYADNIASATAGDITLEHPTSGGASSIIFPSRSNYGSDYGFITYYDENTTYAYWGTSAENSALVIGSQNDGMNSVSDVVALQGDAADVIGTAAYPSTMIVNAANNVGIGTTAPGQKLDVAGGYIRSDTGYCIGGSCITGWPSGAVTSVFGRSGAVVAASGDYSVAQVTGAAPLASPSFTGTLALPATYGGASFTDGGGDAASYSADTIELSSWQGLGMYNPTSGGAYTNQISGFYDFRNGFWDTKAYPRVNGTAINSIFAPLANPTFTGNLTVAGNLSVGNKITATTFDPVYTIGGTNYATYLPGMTGVKEETAGTLDLQRNSDGSYSSTINFASEPTGGDLWLFAKATDMPGAMSQLVVSLTPSFSGNVWYEKNAALGTLTIHGSAAGEVSYNLTAPRFDASQWTNIGDPNAKGLLVK